MSEPTSPHQLSQEHEDKLKLDFVALVSHELRMPVSAIIGYIELLMDRAYGELTPEQEQTLGYMAQNARDLMRMVNDLLQLTNIRAGRTQLSLETVNIRELTRNVLSQLASLHRDKPIKVCCEMPEDLRPLRTDSGKLRQILVNLISNAIKFTREGSVTVTAAPIPSPHDSESAWIEIRVHDTGIGIPADKLAQLFKMFHQVDNKVSREFEGMGLGLYISQYLAQMLGGNITVISESGRGTTFTVRLPMELEGVEAVRRLQRISRTAATSVSATTEEATTSTVAEGQQYVLVLGVDPDVARLLGDSLKKEGFRALRATSAASALKIIGQAKPQAVFVDLTHSQDKAWKILQEMRLDQSAHALPVIYLTDYSEAPPTVASKDAPLTVSTPVHPKEVVETMQVAARRANQNKTILVADDDQWIRELLDEVLRLDGYTVLQAADGRQAMEILESKKPDLLLLDLSMPEMSGWEVIQAAHANPSLSRTRIVVMTGHPLSEEDKESMSQNVLGFLKKGDIKIEKILAEVRAVMQNA